MIKSIRMKLFIRFALFLAAFIFLVFLLNLKYLPNYYVYKNESIFYNVYEHINEINSNRSKKFKKILMEIDKETKIGISILDDNSPAIKYGSKDLKKKIDKDIEDLIIMKMNEIKIDYVYGVFKYSRKTFNSKYIFDTMNEDLSKSEIIFIKALDTGEILLLRKPLDEIIDSSKISNDFLLYVGVITIILGSIFIFFYSKRLTNPIVELSDIAMNIANLNFSKRFKTKSKDEIGILGNSINLISDELQRALDDLIEANVELKEDVERKKQIDEMRKNFISSVSHELKSPIGITRSYAEGLKYNIVNNPEKKIRYCDILIDEAEKMDKIVKQLLSLSHLESEAFKLEKSVFNISVLIDEIIEKFDPILKEKKIETKVITNQNYFVNADYLMIEQVITNFLTNATNHIDKGKYIEVRAQSVGEKVRVSVINSGENIPEEDLRNIWESFYKVDKARSREYGGTGLGLSIVKSIMEHHQEKYSVVNRKFGVEFWFELSLINKE